MCAVLLSEVEIGRRVRAAWSWLDYGVGELVRMEMACYMREGREQ